MNELDFLNDNTTENKIINFYSLYKVNLEYIKKIESFSVDRFYFKITNNSKIKKIQNLINELELYIEAEKIKLDFDKLNGSIVFEISKKNRKILYFEELKNESKSGLTASIGKDINNKEISIDITKTPHLLIAGSTGSGKSCILNNIIVSLLKKYNENVMKLILVDIKQVEFSIYKNQKQLAIPTITNIEKTIDILNKMIVIMNNRYNLLSQKNYRNIEDFNQLENDKLCYYVLIIDELADLFAQSPDIEALLCRLLQLRACCWNPFNTCDTTPRQRNNKRKTQNQYTNTIGVNCNKCARFKNYFKRTRSRKTNRQGRFFTKKTRWRNDKAVKVHL